MFPSPNGIGDIRKPSPIGRWIVFLSSWGLISLGILVNQPFVRGFCERTVPLAMLILTALTTAGCGGRILNFYCGPSRRPLEFLGLASALGWAVLSLVLCLLAAVGQFSAVIFVPVAIVCSLLFGIGVDGRLSGWEIWGSIRCLGWWPILGRRFTTLAAGLMTIVVILVTALWSLGPVWDYDSEMYHLPNAASLLRQHGLVISHEEPLANLPGQAYLWFALGLAAKAEAYPALLVCWATVMTSLLAASIASRWLGIRVALWTVPVFWSALIVHAVASTPRIEPLYSLLFLAAVAWLFEALQRQRLGWAEITFCGICLGTAAAIKAQGLYGWPIIGAWWAWTWIRHRTWRTSGTLIRVTCLFLVGFTILAPWWIKNYRAFGNPIHPMFNRQLDPDSVRNANPHVPSHRSRPWYFLARDTVDLFVKPNTFSGPPGQWPHYIFLVLPLLIVIELSRSKAVLQGLKGPKGPKFAGPSIERHRVMTIAGLAASYYLLSLTLTHELRHQFGMFSLASILVAYVIAQVELRWKWDVFLPGVVSLLLLFVVVFPARLFRIPQLVQYTLGMIDGATLREAMIPPNFPRACDWCNTHLPEDAVILLCWESRVYRLHRTTIADPGSCTWRTLFHNRSTPAEVSAYLHQQRIDYILVNEAALVYQVERSGLIPASVYQEFRIQRDLLVPDILEPVFEYPEKKPKTVAVYRVR